MEGETRVETAANAVDAITQTLSSGAGDEGIARLANSVHSGRTGRYGDAFASPEDTMTWGKGLKLDDIDGSEGQAEAVSEPPAPPTAVKSETSAESEVTATTETATATETPGENETLNPPAPPAPSGDAAQEAEEVHKEDD